jgi:hypothetical protein
VSAGLALAAMLAILWAPQGEPRSVAGRVVRATKTAGVAVPSEWVVLHRVGPDTARPLDSVRTAADGSYHFAYRATGSADAIYFVAARWAGIAYFSPPLKPRVAGGDAELTVFDTASYGVPIHTRGRHVIVFLPRGDGTRQVVEVYEISNDGVRTLISPGEARATWSAPLPDGAHDFQAGQSDISTATMVALRDSAQVFAPIAPGLKQLTFSYRLPPKAFPFVLPAARDSVVLEVLLEEPGTIAAGGGLRAADSVTVDGHRLARWLAPGSPPNTGVRITLPPALPARMGFVIAALAVTMGAAMLGTLARTFSRRA